MESNISERRGWLNGDELPTDLHMCLRGLRSLMKANAPYTDNFNNLPDVFVHPCIDTAIALSKPSVDRISSVPILNGSYSGESYTCPSFNESVRNREIRSPQAKKTRTTHTYQTCCITRSVDRLGKVFRYTNEQWGAKNVATRLG